LLRLHDEKLSGILGRPLPDEAQPSTEYTGSPRIIVPTKRSQIRAGERLSLKVIVLDARRPKRAAIHWRPMGVGDFQEIPLKHVNRGVHAVTLPPAEGLATEYYVQVKTAGDRTLVWPAAAPKINQTVVVVPEPGASDTSTR
jgi:hypothetical protein